jgi:transposase InsO family protein
LPIKDAAVLEAIRKHIKKRPRFGYRKITVELKKDKWYINFKRVYRIWQDYDLKAPKQKSRKKRGRDGCSDNACNKKKPEYINHVWSYDFVTERLENGRKAKMLNILDEHTRECLTIDVAKRITAQDVIDVLRYLFLIRGVPDYIRSDNGPEFTAKKVKKWLKAMNVKTLFIEPGSPWENGYIESFNSHLRNEYLDREIFVSIEELRYFVERWRLDYNHHRPHQSLGYMTPAVFAVTAANVSGALPPNPLDLSHDGSEHLKKEAGQSKLAHAPITAACSGCVPAEPYPCRSNGTIQHELNKSKMTLEK